MMVLPRNTFAELGISSKGNDFFHVYYGVGVAIFAGAQTINTSLDSPNF